MSSDLIVLAAVAIALLMIGIDALRSGTSKGPRDKASDRQVSRRSDGQNSERFKKRPRGEGGWQ